MFIREIKYFKAVIPQFGFMYKASLKENLDPYSNIPHEKMQRVLEKGKDFMNKAAKKHKREQHTDMSINIEEEENSQSERIFSEGFLIEKGGNNLSNGEKQIVNFMRILLRDSDVIFLDEATSNVDPVTGIFYE